MSFENAVQVEMKKMAKNEFRLKKNLLEGLFAVEEYTDRDSYQDVLGDIQTERELVAAGVSGYNASGYDLTTPNRDTPPTNEPPWRRRLTKLLGDSYHVAAYRWHSKYTGRELQQLAAMYAKKAMYAMMRSKQALTIDLFDEIYRENPVINEEPNKPATDVRYPVSSVLFPPLVKNAANSYSAPFTFDTWTAINALLDNNMDQDAMGGGAIENTLSDFKKVAIFSVTGWSVFFRQNIGRVGNADWFGQNFITKDYGNLRTIKDMLIVTLPDKYFMNVVPDTTGASSNSALGTALGNVRRWVLPEMKDANTDLTRYINPANGINMAIAPVISGAGTGPGSANNHATVNGMHKCVVLPRGAFELKKPKQLMVPNITYRDKDKRFERKMFAEWGCEGRRLFENVLLTVYFTADGQLIKST